MTYFQWGFVFLIGAIVVIAIKAEFQTRVFLVLLVIGLMIFAKMKK